MADHDPGVNPEEEGIPDLQNGSPEAERASDPQQLSVPVDEPVASEMYGTTPAEQIEGKPLEDRLAEEEPDITELAPEDVRDEEAGLLGDDANPELPGYQGNQDVYSHVSPAPGLSAEEAAVHVMEEDAAGHAAEEED